VSGGSPGITVRRVPSSTIRRSRAETRLEKRYMTDLTKLRRPLHDGHLNGFRRVPAALAKVAAIDATFENIDRRLAILEKAGVAQADARKGEGARP
jgi:hypothetical protein